jgi:hypothetical protein
MTYGWGRPLTRTTCPTGSPSTKPAADERLWQPTATWAAFWIGKGGLFRSSSNDGELSEMELDVEETAASAGEQEPSLSWANRAPDARLTLPEASRAWRFDEFFDWTRTTVAPRGGVPDSVCPDWTAMYWAAWCTCEAIVTLETV